MDRGYARETRNGLPVIEQLKIIRAAGIDVDEYGAKIYVDLMPSRRQRKRSDSDEALPERAKIIDELRAPSRLVVAGLDRLGVSWGDIMAVFDKVDAKECSIFDALAGIEYSRVTPRQVFTEAAREAGAALRRENLTKARKVRAKRLAEGIAVPKSGNKGWKPDAETDATAKIDWTENLHLSQADLEEKYGVGRSTLRRRYGERGGSPGRPRKVQR